MKLPVNKSKTRSSFVFITKQSHISKMDFTKTIERSENEIITQAGVFVNEVGPGGSDPTFNRQEF